MATKTKAETKILALVRKSNDMGYLAGLYVAPEDKRYATDREFRFVKRLHESGEIVWVPYSPQFGAGWALKEKASLFMWAVKKDPS
jgi:hypothetical protein